MIDVLYVAWNRLRYTQETFAALVDNTDWSQVARLLVHDDGSTDGTAAWLEDACALVAGPEVIFHGDRLAGPVAVMNWYLDGREPQAPCRDCLGRGIVPGRPGQSCPACDGTGQHEIDKFAKVDNDLVVCPGWLPEMLRQMTLHPELDIIGMEPMVGGPEAPPDPNRTITAARHIGGKGVLRHRAFERCRMVPRGYYGFTEWQHTHESVTKAWITPDLPVFGLDQLPFEPWRGLADHYEAEGWQRRWAEYAPISDDYWSWWNPIQE